MSSDETRSSGLRVRPWNLFLLIPLLVLVTPLFNMDSPRLFGIPFFYWFQLLFVLVGVLCVAVVYVTTKDEPTSRKPDRLSVDDLDEGDPQ